MRTRRSFVVEAAALALTGAAPALAAPRSAGVVHTVTGPISGARMGVTAPHEHIFAASTDMLRLWPEYVGGRAALTQKAVLGLKAAKAAGIDTIVDCTTADLGRNIPLLQEVSRKSGVQIIAVTGHWLTPTPSFEQRSVEELAQFFTLEIERGIEGTGVKPGAIKGASQGGEITPFQEKVFRAAARTSKKTGIPVSTHSDARHRDGEKQVALLEAEGLDPRRVCIGHSDESTEFDYLAGLAKRGYTIGFDHLMYGLPVIGGGTRGSPTWQDRAAMMKRMIDAGYTDRLFLATDWMYGLGIDPTGTMELLDKANPDGNLFNVHKTIPLLRQLGVTEAQLRTITVDNPRAFFARA